MRRAAKKTVVIIYGVMYTKLYEYTLRTKAITCIGRESLNPGDLVCVHHQITQDL